MEQVFKAARAVSDRINVICSHIPQKYTCGKSVKLNTITSDHMLFHDTDNDIYIIIKNPPAINI